MKRAPAQSFCGPALRRNLPGAGSPALPQGNECFELPSVCNRAVWADSANPTETLTFNPSDIPEERRFEVVPDCFLPAETQDAADALAMNHAAWAVSLTPPPPDCDAALFNVSQIFATSLSGAFAGRELFWSAVGQQRSVSVELVGELTIPPGRQQADALDPTLTTRFSNVSGAPTVERYLLDAGVFEPGIYAFRYKSGGITNAGGVEFPIWWGAYPDGSHARFGVVASGGENLAGVFSGAQHAFSASAHPWLSDVNGSLQVVEEFMEGQALCAIHLTTSTRLVFATTSSAINDNSGPGPTVEVFRICGPGEVSAPVLTVSADNWEQEGAWLSWTPSDGAINYRYEFRTAVSPDVWEIREWFGPSVTGFYQDTAWANLPTLAYRVAAVSAAGSLHYSNVVEIPNPLGFGE